MKIQIQFLILLFVFLIVECLADENTCCDLPAYQQVDVSSKWPSYVKDSKGKPEKGSVVKKLLRLDRKEHYSLTIRNISQPWKGAMESAGILFQGGVKSILVPNEGSIWGFGETIISTKSSPSIIKNNALHSTLYFKKEKIKNENKFVTNVYANFSYFVTDEGKATCMIPIEYNKGPCEETTLWPTAGFTLIEYNDESDPNSDIKKISVYSWFKVKHVANSHSKYGLAKANWVDRNSTMFGKKEKLALEFHWVNEHLDIPFAAESVVQLNGSVYMYFTDERREYIYLARVVSRNIEDPSFFEYFTLQQSWSKDKNHAYPISQHDSINSGVAVVWNSHLKRYMMLTTFRDDPAFVALLTSLTPWGPWNGEIIPIFKAGNPTKDLTKSSTLELLETNWHPELHLEQGRRVFITAGWMKASHSGSSIPLMVEIEFNRVSVLPPWSLYSIYFGILIGGGILTYIFVVINYKRDDSGSSKNIHNNQYSVIPNEIDG